MNKLNNLPYQKTPASIRVFIVGVGRSGTSLLQSMLAAHPDIRAFPETSFLRRYPFSIARSPCGFLDDRALERVEGFSDRLAKLNGVIAREDMIDAYMDVVSDLNGRAVLDKDPRLVEFIPNLYKSFGGCVKVVHIFRDPRDVLASKKKAAWSSGRHLIEYLVASYVQLRDACKAEHQYEILSISYESLIENPKDCLVSVLEYIGLPYNDSVLDHANAAKSLVHGSELAWKKETFRPVNADNSGKWSKELQPVEAVASALMVKSFFESKGLELVDPNISGMEWLKSRFFVLVSRLVACAYVVKRYIQRKSRGII